MDQKEKEGRVHLDDISVLQDSGVILEGREVSGAVVDGDAGGEGDSLGLDLALGVVVDSSDTSVDELVSKSTELNDALTSNQLGDELVDDIYFSRRGVGVVTNAAKDEKRKKKKESEHRHLKIQLPSPLRSVMQVIPMNRERESAHATDCPL